MTQSFSCRKSNEKLIEEGYQDSSAYRILAAAIYTALDLSVPLTDLFDLVCRELDIFPNYDIEEETERIPVWWRLSNLCRQCDWFESYDVVESIHENIDELAQASYGYEKTSDMFEEQINKKFERYKSEWELVDGQVKKKYLTTKSDEQGLAKASKPAKDLGQDTKLDKTESKKIALPSRVEDWQDSIEPLVRGAKQLATRWEGNFRNSRIDFVDILDWLNQFQTEEEKKLMMKLLQRFEFFSHSRCYDELRVLQKRVLNELNISEEQLDTGKKKFLLCAAEENGAKSSYTLSRMFHQSNQMPRNSVTTKESLTERIDESIQAIVLVDDLFGTGDSCIRNLKKLDHDKLAKNHVLVILASISASTAAIEKIEEEISVFPSQVQVVTNHRLDKCFESLASVFDSDEDMERAKEVAYRNGVRLSASHPLGHKNSQLLVAFHDNCPN